MTDFLTALKNRKANGQAPVIPDIKCFSPKEGDLMRGRDPVRIAGELAAAGACVLSVVTEPSEFHGSPDLLRRICASVSVPVLRKDFLETRDDLLETKEAGASAVLLMYSCLGKDRLEVLYREALSIGLIPFVETHTEEELHWAAELNAPLVGINNRDILQLERDDGDVSHAAALLRSAPQDAFLVVESGLRNGSDVRRAVRCGADAALVGTAILQEDDPAAMYRSMIRPCDLKICGLMDETGIDLCLQNHVDMLGFVTEYPVDVPWNMDREQAAKLLDYLRGLKADRTAVPPSCIAAGSTEGKSTSPSCIATGSTEGKSTPPSCIVTGGSVEKVISLAGELRPDAVQLHYTESLSETAEIADKLHSLGIQVIRSIPSGLSLRRQMFGTEKLQQIVSLLGKTEVDTILLDSRDAANAAAGGGSILQSVEDTGIRELCADSGKTFMLGGGLTADTVEDAVRVFAPDVIDIMSGSETAPGKKSEARIREIISGLEAVPE